MKPFKTTFALVAVTSSFLFATAGLAQTQSINTFPTWNGSDSESSWGPAASTTTIYGQTFTPTAGQTTPRNITFAIQNNSGFSIPFQAFVYKWTGTTITGPALFQSTVMSDPSGGSAFANIKVKLSSTGNGGLSPGQQYVVFYSTVGLGGSASANSRWGWQGNVYQGGNFVYQNTQFGAGFSMFDTWDGLITGQDAAFLLTFGIGAFTPYALTPNQHAVASALDYAVATNNPGIQNLVNYLGNLPTNYLPASFDMISGEEYTSVFDTAYAIAHLQNQAITNHLASIQAGEPGLSLGLVTLDMASGGKSTTDGKDSKIVTQPVVDNRWGFFATANGDFTDITGDTNANGFQYATEGLTLGVDYRVLPQLVLGAYLAYEHSYTSLINDGALDQNGITGGLYGSWFSQGFYVDGIVGGGYSGFTGRRQTVGGFTRGDGDNTLLNAAINGGYDMHYGAWTFGPQLGIEYDDVWLNSFTENGSLAPLSVASQSENSLRSTAGGHISYTTHVGGVTVRPDVHAAWQHEYDSPANSLGAQIAGTNAAFVVQGPYLGRNSALAGAGVTVELSEKTSVYADYEGQFGRSHETQSTVSVGFQTKF